MWEYTGVLVRSNGPPLPLLHTIRAQLASLNPEQQTGNEADDLEQWIRDEPEWQQGNLVTWIFGAFSLLALALATVGLYSVVSYAVTQRTNEFGIRMALGAQREHVMRIVFSSMLVSVGSGIVAGLGLSLALNKILATWAEASCATRSSCWPRPFCSYWWQRLPARCRHGVPPKSSPCQRYAASR